MLGWLFGKKRDEQAEEEALLAWDRAKSEFFASFLGPEHDRVMHAPIPFAIGGALDLYYFPSNPDAPGTMVVTKELVERPGRGPRNKAYRAYELAIATRRAFDLDAAKDAETDFGRTHQRMNLLLNHLARYAMQAELNPNETCEFPADMEDVGGTTLIFDALAPIDGASAAKVGLMAIIEIHPDECAFARERGGAELIGRLRAHGCYPYSDLDRPSVV